MAKNPTKNGRTSRNMISERSRRSRGSQSRTGIPMASDMHMDELDTRGTPYRYYGTQAESADIFTRRNLWVLAMIRQAIGKIEDPVIRDALMFGFTGVMLNSSKMYKERESGRGISNGMHYMPQVFRDMVVTNGLDYKIKTQLIPAFEELSGIQPEDICISTQSSTDMSAIPSNSIDYIFTHPPYADKVQYGELNFVWEAWLGFDTSWHDDEIIVNEVRGRSEADWEAMMSRHGRVLPRAEAGAVAEPLLSRHVGRDLGPDPGHHGRGRLRG